MDVEGRMFRVVVNEKRQYSIWLADKEIPPGWIAEGMSGTKEVCLEHIEQVWADMRPQRSQLSVDSIETSM